MFSCLFDTGAEVSCMNVDTCTALGLLDSVSDTNTQVNTASGQDMGILGHVMVTFKLGKQSFTHKFLVCRFLTRPFILGEDYLSKNCMSMEWDGNRRAISYRSNMLVTASQEVMEEPLKLCNAIKIPARSFVVAPTYWYLSMVENTRALRSIRMEGLQRFCKQNKEFCVQIRMDGKLSQTKLSSLKIYYLSLTLRVVSHYF